MRDAERIELQRACIAAHLEGENAHDWERVWATFVSDRDAWYVDAVPASTTFRGLSGVDRFYQNLEVALPDFTVTATAEVDTPGVSVRELTVAGTHRGEYCGIPASGRHIAFELSAFYIFGDGSDAGRLIAERVYFDNETILRQMRGEADATGVGLLARQRTAV